MYRKRILPILVLIMVTLWFFPLNGVAQEILFSDTFTGVRGSRPANWEIVDATDPAYWYLQDGQFCTGNGDNLLVPGGYSYAVVRVPGSEQWRNYSVECTAWMLQRNGKIIIVGRWQDKYNHYRGELELYEGKRVMKIVRVQNGEEKLLSRLIHGRENIVIPAIENGSGPIDSKYFCLTFENNKITFTYDKLVLEATDNVFTQGPPGLGEWYNYIFFDNFVVKRVGVKEAIGIVKPATPVQATPRAAPTEIAPISQPQEMGLYQLLVATSVDKQVANNLRDQLLNWGYIPVNMLKKSEDQYDILVGSFPTKEEATRARGFLEKDGLVVVDIVRKGKRTGAVQKAEEITERRIYRVMIGEFNDENSANQLKAQMENAGFVALDVVPEDGKYKVYAGGKFVQQNEAEKFSEYLKKEGFLFAKVTTEKVTKPVSVAYVPPVSPVSTGKPGEKQLPFKIEIPEDIRQMKEWQQLSEEERQRVLDSISRERMIKYSSPLAQELADLRKQLQQLSSAQREIVQTVRQRFEEQEKMKKKISSLFAQVDQAIDAHQWDKGLALLAKIEKIDPTNAKIDLKRRAIEMGKKNLKFAGQDILEEKFRKEIEKLRKSAQEYEQMGNLVAAISQWENVKAKTDPTSFDYQEATRKIGELRSKLQEKQRLEEAKSKRLEMIGYLALVLILIIGVVVALVIVIAGRRQKKILQQVQEIALKPMMELGEGQRRELPETTTVTGVEKKEAGVFESAEEVLESVSEKEASPQKEEEPVAPKVEETGVVEPPVAEEKIQPSEEEIFTAPFESPEEVAKESETRAGGVEKEPSVEEAFEEISLPEIEPLETGKEKKEREEEFAVEDIESLLKESEEKEEVSAPEPEPEPEETIEIPDIVSLEELKFPPGVGAVEEQKVEEQKAEKKEAEEEKEKEEVPVAPEEAVSEPTEKIKLNEEETVILSKPTPPEVEKEEKEEVSEAVAGETVLFEQGFDDEPVGKPPKGWNGSYDYATLTVVDETPAPGSKHCLKFEKKTGAGSAYYFRRFEDITGVVQIEFDLRCDNKNKYLLGVYLEKDGDFRQSIHTIIHRTEAQANPSLRIHGEPVPYIFKSWRRIKYVIDLNTGTLDGYVDGEQVSSKVHLASNPKRLNTISIRDNLATTGVLKLDNIRIVKL
ncbi:SPOR domain-containing protein [Candidatus Sumerlaeota bacterium]|nr:SPOR domain-containing protein [Candidatus Sumerlaeota bacterium]